MDPVRRELRDEADNLVRALQRVGITLSYDREGVAAVDGYVEDNRAYWDDADRERLTGPIGAFVGECMVETYGASWHADPERGPGIALPTGDTAFPLTKAGKHIRGDHSDGVLSFFETVGAIIAKGGITQM
ncbi:MAG: hypothetical protein IAG13_24905 [Deltaproteobacteria bacterium]|nr:hypothetical protein [Nannocystaceae bacterium]